MKKTGPFSGIKVIEFTHWLAGPYTGTILSDFGAEVIKVEALNGDQVRRTNEKNAPFLYAAYNHGKKGISINLKNDRGKKIAWDLVKEADVIIENFRPGVMDKLSLSYDDIKTVYPNIIYCSITAFGDTPKYRNRPGMDPIIQGMGGVMSMTAEDENSPPLLPGISIADNSTAFMAFGAIASALYERERSGKGQHIKLNLIDMMVFNLSTRYGQYLANKENPKPLGNQHSQVVPYQAFPTKDGWIMAGAQKDEAWKPFCEAIGREDLSTIERFQTNAKRVKHRDELSKLLNEIFREKTTGEWCERFEEKNVLHGPIWGIEELVNSDLIQDHSIIQDIEHSDIGNLPLIKTPIKYSRSEVSIQSGANKLGEHTQELLRGLGYEESAIEEMIAQDIIRSSYR